MPLGTFQISARLTMEDLAKLDAQAQEACLPRAQYVRLLLRGDFESARTNHTVPPVQLCARPHLADHTCPELVVKENPNITIDVSEEAKEMFHTVRSENSKLLQENLRLTHENTTLRNAPPRIEVREKALVKENSPGHILAPCKLTHLKDHTCPVPKTVKVEVPVPAQPNPPKERKKRQQSTSNPAKEVKAMEKWWMCPCCEATMQLRTEATEVNPPSSANLRGVPGMEKHTDWHPLQEIDGEADAARWLKTWRENAEKKTKK